MIARVALLQHLLVIDVELDFLGVRVCRHHVR